MRRVRSAAWSLAVAVAVVLLAPTVVPAEHGFVWQVGRNDFTFEVSDGVLLDAVLFVPDGTVATDRLPALVIIHGYGGSKDARSASQAADDGFVGFAYSVRGFGDSGGLMDVVGPRTMQDLREAVAWLKAHAPVNPDGVGVVGASYGGAHAALIAVDEEPVVAAVAAAATWTDLARGLAPNGVAKLSYPMGFYLTGQGFTRDGDMPVPLEFFGQDVGRKCVCDTYHPDIHRWAVASATGVGRDQFLADAAERSALRFAERVKVPVYFAQGFNDDLFPADEALSFFERLPGDDHRLYLGTVGHPRADADGAEVDWALDRVADWFRYHLAGEGAPPGDADARIEVADAPWTGATRNLSAWPAVADGTFLRFTGGNGLVEGAAPTRAVAAFANTLVAGLPQDPVLPYLWAPWGDLPAGTPADTVAFTSEPFAEATRLLGTPRAALVLSASAPQHIVSVKLFDVPPQGDALLLSRGVFKVTNAVPGFPADARFDLMPYHHVFEPGHRLEVRVAASDFPAFYPEWVPFSTLMAVGGPDGSGVRVPLAPVS